MGKQKKKTITIKMLRLARVRCDQDHKNPWLRRLYILWAPVKPDGTAGDVFRLGQTDINGYFTVPENDLDPHHRVQPLVSEIDYLLYLIRHPGDDLPKKILDDVNAGSKKWGEAKKYRFEKVEVGKDKHKKPITELILKIPEDPTVFTPVGSDFYQKWVLFRYMPGTGDGKLDSDIQCPPLLEQVRRLQFHLGAMRYWVGDHTHPYSPESFAKPKSKYDYHKPNEGVFDVVTWNSVLAFQRDAKEGKAIELDKTVKRVPVLTPGSFDPTDDAKNDSLQRKDAPNYVSGVAANSGDATASIDYLTVVDKTTGDTIKKWLESGFRKPGSVLIAHEGPETWMNTAALKSFSDWSSKLDALGFKQGVRVSNVLRDPRIGLVTGGGMISTSIHKSGFALDLTMDAFAKGMVGGKYPYPLYYERDSNVTSKIRWIVYALVKDEKIPKTMTQQTNAAGDITGYTSPTESFVEYKKTISNFEYDQYSPDGGKSVSLSIPDHSFLNVTKIANHFGFARIGPHAIGWQGYPEATVVLTDTAAFTTFVGRLKRHLDQEKNKEYDPDEASITVNKGAAVKIKGFKDSVKYLNAWLDLAGRHGANPEITVKPTTKEGEMLLNNLKTKKPKKKEVDLKGNLKFIVTEDGKEKEIKIDKDTEFPTKEFKLRPVFTPVDFKPGDSVDFPKIVGSPPHLEWWHFQYVDGYKGKLWVEILGDIGWTLEGLSGEAAGNQIYGLFGLGYSSADLGKSESTSIGN